MLICVNKGQPVAHCKISLLHSRFKKNQPNKQEKKATKQPKHTNKGGGEWRNRSFLAGLQCLFHPDTEVL